MRHKFFTLMITALFFAFSANAQVDMAPSKSGKVDLNTERITNTMPTGLKSGKLDYISESFDTEIPATWTIVNNGAGSGWLWASGTPYIDSDAAGSGVHESAELQSPAVDVTGAGVLNLAFDSYYNNIGDDRAYVDVWNGTEWITLEEYDADHGTGATDMMHFEYDVTDHINADFQVRFNYDDMDAWAWYWYIDNVVVFEPEDNDLGANAVTPGGVVMTGSTITPTVTIENYGALAQSTYDITLVSDPAGYDETISDPGNIDPGSTLTVDFPDWAPDDGIYTLTATVVLTDDANPGNDVATSEIEVRGVGFGDVAYTFTTEAAGCPGIETDGTHIYTVYWNPGTAGRNFDKYTMDGTFVEEFEITGVSAVRDMAYNPNTGYFYGAAADASLFELDLDAQTLENTITIPTDSRAILYDDDDDTFWANNWASDLTEFDITGTATGNTIAVESMYGAAYDNWTDPANPTIWAFTSDGGTPANTIIEYNMDGTLTGREIDPSIVPGFDAGIGGGLASFEVDGVAYLAANIQQDPNLVAVFYLTEPDTEMYTVTFTVDDGADPIEGANINVAGADLTTGVNGEATIDLTDGEYYYTVTMEGYAEAYDTINVAGEAISETVSLNPVYSVTFNVDMRDAIVNGDFDPAMDTLIDAGSMNGWMEPGMDTTMFMHDMDEDSIYTLEMHLTDGDYEYKYFNGAGWDGGEWEGGDNRMFTVAGAAVVLDDVWGQEVGIGNTAEALDFNIYPNPTNGLLHIEVDGNSKVSITNAIGQTIKKVEINGHSTLDLTNNAPGVYFIRIASENKVATKRVIVQ